VLLPTTVKPSIPKFTQRIQRESHPRRFPQASRTVVLGDGAPYLWNITEELLPDAIQIVDRFHVQQHLRDVAKAIYGPDHPWSQTWAEQRHQELDQGRWQPLLRAMRRQALTSNEARQCLDYLNRNCPRMRYAEFHARDFALPPELSKPDARRLLALA